MRRITAMAFVLSLLASRFVLAGEAEACKGEKSCPGEKISKLLTSWKALAEEGKTACPNEKAQLNTEFASLVKSCPMGSRMPETLGFVKSVLAVSFSEKEACEKACPAAQAAKAAAAVTVNSKTVDSKTADSKEAKAEPCCELSKAMTARASLGRDLHQLVSFALAAMPGSACCAKEGEACKKESKETTVASTSTTTTAAAPAAAAPAAAGKTACCEGAGGVCCKELATKAQALKASWDKVGGEFASMCPVAKKELFASMKSLGERSKAINLLPQSVMALADGIEALEAMDAKLNEYAKAHPDQLKDVPEETKKCFTQESTLIHEAGEVLRRVRTAGAACQGDACPEKEQDAAKTASVTG